MAVPAHGKEILGDIAKQVKSDAESYDCKFVEPIPEEVQTVCSICLLTLKEPCIVGCCGNRFCKACIKPAKQLRFCPLCKASNFQMLPDKQLERLLNQRNVYCLLRDSGCKWTGELNKLPNHLHFVDDVVHVSTSLGKTDICEFLPIPCVYCKEYFRRIDMEKHKSNCNARPSVCKYCCYKCPFKDLVSQHLQKCSLYPITCKNLCGKDFKRKDLEAHLANDCPLQKVDCEYRYAGCGEKVSRKDVADHMEMKLRTHLSLVSTRCKQLIDKEKKNCINVLSYNELKRENKALKIQFADIISTCQEVLVENELLKNNLKEKEERSIQQLLVTNLPPTATEQHLKSVFGQHGSVVHVNLLTANIAFIKYSTNDEYEKVIEASMSRGINLLQHQLELHLIYSL